MPNHTGSALLALAIAAALAGCQTPKHTDLLVFGTNTQFGVALSSDATTNPGVNIGYKRQEVVLMPLYVNAQDSELKTCPVPPFEGKYIGTDGSPTSKQDTYSVLASFGAKGSANTTGNAEVGIAQYFATGLAARTLAYAGGSLINTGNEAARTAPETAKAAASAETDAIVATMLEDSKRFTAEGEIIDGFSKLNSTNADSFLDKLNKGLNRAGAGAVTAANLQQQLSTMNLAEISYANQLVKNP